MLESFAGYDAWKTTPPHDYEGDRREAEDEAYAEAEARYEAELDFESLCRSIGDESPWRPDFDRCLWLERRARGLERDEMDY